MEGRDDDRQSDAARHGVASSTVTAAGNDPMSAQPAARSATPDTAAAPASGQGEPAGEGRSGWGVDQLGQSTRSAPTGTGTRFSDGRAASAGRSPARSSGDAPAYGALDLGTNNCRLLVARPTRRGFHVIDAFSRIIRLGEGIATTGKLSETAMERAIEALRVCKSKIERQRVVRAQLVATEACRIASNGTAFIDRVRQEIGLDLVVLTREQEARYAVSGCASLIDVECDDAMVFDIGGGSSELIWLDLKLRRGQWRRSLADRLEANACISAWTSLPVGVVSLAEQFGGRNVTEASFEAMVDLVTKMIEPFEAEHKFRDKVRNGRVHLLGTSGTVTTVAGILLGLPRYDRNRVDGTWLATEDAHRVTYALLRRTYEERVAEPCIGRERADLVLAGCAILEAVLRMWPAQRLRVADRGLREGILATLMAEDAHVRDRGWRSDAAR